MTTFPFHRMHAHVSCSEDVYIKEPMRTAFLVFLILSIAAVALVAAEQTPAIVKNLVDTTTGQEVKIITVSVMGTPQLRLYCVAGSLVGAGIALCFFKSAGLREMASKVFGSALFGIAFAPGLCHWLVPNLGPDSIDFVLLWAGFMSMFASSIIAVAQPLVPKVVSKLFGAKTGIS